MDARLVVATDRAVYAPEDTFAVTQTLANPGQAVGRENVRT
jgi:hypothetical protein